jgi:hypothetical protein
MLAVEFAVIGTGDGVHLLVEHRDFVGFETVGKEASEGTFVEGLVWRGDDEELEGMASDGMRGRDANAVTDHRIRHGHLLHFDGRDFEATDVDDIRSTT